LVLLLGAGCAPVAPDTSGDEAAATDQAALKNSEPCTFNFQCDSGICGPEVTWGKTRADLCQVTYTYRCTTGAVGEGCHHDSDCKGDLICAGAGWHYCSVTDAQGTKDAAATDWTCQPKNKPIDTLCTEDRECASGHCDWNGEAVACI
jgi:hypothetical protein